MSGKLLLRLKKEDTELRKRLEEIMEGTKVRTLKNTDSPTMYIRNIDAITEAAEVKRAITNNDISGEKVRSRNTNPLTQ